MDVLVLGTFAADACSLTLHTSKRPGGTGSPLVEADGVTWGGVQWKEIRYVE